MIPKSAVAPIFGIWISVRAASPQRNCSQVISASPTFSFLIFIPGLAARIFLECRAAGQAFDFSMPLLLASFGAAALAGYLAIFAFQVWVRRGHFYQFGIYHLLIGFFSLLYAIIASFGL